MTAPPAPRTRISEGRVADIWRPVPTLVHRQTVGGVRTVDLAAAALQPTDVPGRGDPPSLRQKEEAPNWGLLLVSLSVSYSSSEVSSSRWPVSTFTPGPIVEDRVMASI